MRPIIRVDSLTKQFRIGTQRSSYNTLRDMLAQAVRAPFKQFGRNGRAREETIWALMDVSFEVRPGEVVGIIGRNGAGKSTLLKILSRITEPTSGSVDLYGRVASLLEVGTGFHPELTGRENVYLNGAILGMKRQDISRKFDEIVAFSEVDRFIDTPVKHYSSGMHMRLAFAVAAHLEPEILIVDEVLAVGDLQFQRKCIGKMDDIASKGRTVLFVSHNISAVTQLCGECMLLNAGNLVVKGTTAEVIAQYMADASQPQFVTRIGPRRAICEVGIRLLDEHGGEMSMWRYDERLEIEVTIKTATTLYRPAVDIAFYFGATRLIGLQSDKMATSPEVISGCWVISFLVDNPGLAAREMYFDVGLRQGTEPYAVLISEAGRLVPDYSTFPKPPLNDCVLYPQANVSWKCYHAA